MSNKDDWNEIENSVQNRNIMEKEKYKIDILDAYNKKVRNTKGLFTISMKKVIVIICIIIIASIILSIYKTYMKYLRTESIILETGRNMQEVSYKTGIFGNGLYVYQSNDMPEIEIHAVFNIFKEKQGKAFETDAIDKINKYYFEHWNDETKEKFVVEEKYNDIRSGLITKKNWKCSYKIYIEANTETELENAINIEVRYIDYFTNYNNNVNLSNNIYIKYMGNIIYPIHSANKKSEKEIRNNIQEQINNL